MEMKKIVWFWSQAGVMQINDIFFYKGKINAISITRKNR